MPRDCHLARTARHETTMVCPSTNKGLVEHRVKISPVCEPVLETGACRRTVTGVPASTLTGCSREWVALNVRACGILRIVRNCVLLDLLPQAVRITNASQRESIEAKFRFMAPPPGRGYTVLSIIVPIIVFVFQQLSLLARGLAAVFGLPSLWQELARCLLDGGGK